MDSSNPASEAQPQTKGPRTKGPKDREQHLTVSQQVRALKDSGPKRSGATGGLSLRLYVAGHSPNSVAATANLRTLCAELHASSPLIEIVDVLQEPERALKDGIMVTPMLVRLSPEPTVQILGALSDLGRVRLALGIEPQAKHDHA